jgi:hypothetical protein
VRFWAGEAAVPLLGVVRKCTSNASSKKWMLEFIAAMLAPPNKSILASIALLKIVILPLLKIEILDAHKRIGQYVLALRDADTFELKGTAVERTLLQGTAQHY